MAFYKVLSITLLIVSITQTFVAATADAEGTRTIRPRDYWSVSHKGPFKLSYHVVSETANVDVYLLSETNYHKWTKQLLNDPNYVAEASRLNTMNAKLDSYEVDHSGTYYVVIFNTHYTKSTVVDYDIDFGMTKRTSLHIWAILLIILGAILLAGGIGAMLYYVFRGPRHEGEPLLGRM